MGSTGRALIGLAFIAPLALLVWMANSRAYDHVWPPSAAALSRADVRRDPLDPAALRNLGLAELAGGEIEAGQNLMTFAGERGWRDTPTQTWLLESRFAEGRFRLGMRDADSLLRRNTDDASRERLYALLVAAAHYDASRPALVVRLGRDPWWRLSYVRKLAASADPKDVGRVLGDLRSTTHPAAPMEIAAYMHQLIAIKAYGEAAREWAALTKRNPNDVANTLSPPPFGWSDVFGPGGSSTLSSGGIEIDYDGFSSPQLPRRLLALPAGAYVVSWRQRVTAEHGAHIRVGLLCAEGAILARSEGLTATAWVGDALHFQVPASGCEGQYLAILADPGERRQSVVAAFKDWRLAREP